MITPAATAIQPITTAMITHCNAPDRAETIKKLLTDKVQFRDCLIMDTRGVSSMYANDGGVIVTV